MAQMIVTSTNNEELSDADILEPLPRVIGRLLGRVLQFLVLAWLVRLLVFGFEDVIWQIQFIGTLAIIWMLFSGWGWVLLLAIQLSLLVREPGRSLNVEFLEVFTAAVVLIILAYAFSRAIRDSINERLANVSEFLSAQGDEVPVEMGSLKSRSIANSLLSVASRALPLLLAVVISVTLLQRLPVSDTTRASWLSHAAENGNVLWPGATLLVLIVAASVVLSELAFRQFTVRQAKLYARSAFVTYHFSDLVLLINRRFKAASQKARAGKSKR